MSLRRARAEFDSLAEGEKAAFLAVISGERPPHPGLLYNGFESLDERGKDIFLSLLGHSKNLSLLLHSEAGRALFDRMLQEASGVFFRSFEAMAPSQKRRLLSSLCVDLAPDSFPLPASAEFVESASHQGVA